MDKYVFNIQQLLDLEKYDVRQAEDIEDLELEGINMAMWEKKK